jgi:ABC-2 type transport system ATP-binding protein
MKKLGKKRLTVHLKAPLERIPAELASLGVTLNDAGETLEYTFDSVGERSGIPALLANLGALGIAYSDLNTHQSSLEDIFVSLVRGSA